MLGINTKPSLYRDFALLSILIVFILFIVSVWVSYETYQDHSENTIKQLENESVRIDRALIIEIERASYLLESLSRQVGQYGTEDKQQIVNLFASFDKTDYPKNSEFFWVSPDQHITISSSKGFIEKPISVSDRDYMKKAITSAWEIHIGQPVQGRVSRKWVMPVAMGLTDEHGVFLGALVISLDINSFSRELSNVIKEAGVSFAITNKAFTLLTEISDTSDFFSTHFDISHLARIDFSKETSGVYSYASLFDSNSIFAYYEKSSQFPYIIFVGYDATISSAAIRGILAPRIFQIIIIALFLLSILWMVRKRIIQPVIDLTASTSSIVRGEKFEAIKGDSPSEIEHLSDEIKRMADYITECKRTELELRGKNNELLKIRESAELTNDIKAQFFEQVGRSLLSPTKTIMEYAESFEGQLFGALGNPKYAEMGSEIHRNSKDIMDILHDILAISKAESGLLSLKESQIDIPFALQKCVRLLNERTRFATVDIFQDVADDLPLLLADELRIKQLLLNLLMGAASQVDDNNQTVHVAVNTSKHGFHIHIRYKPHGSYELTSRGKHPQSFSANLQVGNVGDTQLAGSAKGLGIALSKLIVAMHEGTLDVKTATDGSVTMTITFPEKRML